MQHVQFSSLFCVFSRMLNHTMTVEIAIVPKSLRAIFARVWTVTSVSSHMLLQTMHICPCSTCHTKKEETIRDGLTLNLVELTNCLSHTVQMYFVGRGGRWCFILWRESTILPRTLRPHIGHAIISPCTFSMCLGNEFIHLPQSSHCWALSTVMFMCSSI